MLEHESITIVLVGLCNEDPFLQTLVGVLVFREGVDGKFEPRLIDPDPNEDIGSNSNPFQATFQWKMKGKYGLSFPVCRGHGVAIRLNVETGKYDFMTGINHSDSGSSGPLSNGGPELVQALDKLFFPDIEG